MMMMMHRCPCLGLRTSWMLARRWGMARYCYSAAGLVRRSRCELLDFFPSGQFFCSDSFVSRRLPRIEGGERGGEGRELTGL